MTLSTLAMRLSTVSEEWVSVFLTCCQFQWRVRKTIKKRPMTIYRFYNWKWKWKPFRNEFCFISNAIHTILIDDALVITMLQLQTFFDDGSNPPRLTFEPSFWSLYFFVKLVDHLFLIPQCIFKIEIWPTGRAEMKETWLAKTNCPERLWIKSLRPER